MLPPLELVETASSSKQPNANADAKTGASTTSAGRRRIGAAGAINQIKKNRLRMSSAMAEQ
jgi:hypothetical protein